MSLMVSDGLKVIYKDFIFSLMCSTTQHDNHQQQDVTGVHIFYWRREFVPLESKTIAIRDAETIAFNNMSCCLLMKISVWRERMFCNTKKKVILRFNQFSLALSFLLLAWVAYCCVFFWIIYFLRNTHQHFDNLISFENVFFSIQIFHSLLN